MRKNKYVEFIVTIMTKISVFCSSSRYVDKIYFDKSAELALRMIKEGDELIFGGSDIGLMGHIAHTMVNGDGIVRGVTTKQFLGMGLEFKEGDELIVTKTMSLRKDTIISMSEAFIALPGGFGTIEEIFEVLTLKQLDLLDAPIVFYNVNGYYDQLMDFIRHSINEKFIKTDHHKLYLVSDNLDEIFEYIKQYTKPSIDRKW
ncbi:MAG: TIGR00730 family Rossman fold protein [Candidatus Heimdallarchaeota archaeon]|nr:TIGR00730 family Rossman fold protein [Candidatus Heimdallarchaeota archaeon]